MGTSADVKTACKRTDSHLQKQCDMDLKTRVPENLGGSSALLSSWFGVFRDPIEGCILLGSTVEYGLPGSCCDTNHTLTISLETLRMQPYIGQTQVLNKSIQKKNTDPSPSKEVAANLQPRFPDISESGGMES